MKPILLLILIIIAISEPVRADEARKLVEAHYKDLAEYSSTLSNKSKYSPVHLLAAAVYHEARENAVTRWEVDTIFNRTNSKHFPNTITEVIMQHKQFSFIADLKYQQRDMFQSMNKEPYEKIKAYRVASLMLYDFHKGTWQPSPKMTNVLYYSNLDKLRNSNGTIIKKWINMSCLVHNVPSSHSFFTCHKNA